MTAIDQFSKVDTEPNHAKDIPTCLVDLRTVLNADKDKLCPLIQANPMCKMTTSSDLIGPVCSRLSQFKDGPGTCSIGAARTMVTEICMGMATTDAQASTPMESAERFMCVNPKGSLPNHKCIVKPKTLPSECKGRLVGFLDVNECASSCKAPGDVFDAACDLEGSDKTDPPHAEQTKSTPTYHDEVKNGLNYVVKEVGGGGAPIEGKEVGAQIVGKKVDAKVDTKIEDEKIDTYVGDKVDTEVGDKTVGNTQGYQIFSSEGGCVCRLSNFDSKKFHDLVTCNDFLRLNVSSLACIQKPIV
jgi:hypothetical protein